MATGTTAFTYDEGADGIGQKCNVKKVTFTWTCTAGGAAADTSKKIVGRLIKAVTVPTDGPTDNYDIAITDDNGVDVLASCQSTLADRHTANTEEAYFLVKDAAGTPLAQSVHPRVCSPLTFTIANAGGSKSGTIVLYYQPV